MYQLSTKSYYDMCGFLAATKTRDRWRKAAGLKDMDAQLSRDFETCNSRTWDSNVYLAYVESTTATWWSRVWDEVSQPKHQKLRFSVYQKQQRAFHTVAVQLCNKNIANSVVLWGGGGFGPTSRGHASAPNKLLRRKLADHGVKIFVVDEYKSSQLTACCHKPSEYSHQRQQLCKKAIEKQQQREQQMRADGQEPQPPTQQRSHELRGLLYCKSRDYRSFALHDHIYRHHNGNLQVDADRARGAVEEVKAAEAAEAAEAADGAVQSSNSSTAGKQQPSGWRPWNRDVCAAINILGIAFLAAKNELPKCFARERARKR